MKYICYILVFFLFIGCKIITIPNEVGKTDIISDHSDIYWLTDLVESPKYANQANLPKTYISNLLKCSYGKRKLLYTAVIHNDKVNKTDVLCYIIATITTLDDTTAFKDKVCGIEHISLVENSEKQDLDSNTLSHKYHLNCGENLYEIVSHHIVWSPTEVITINCVNYNNNKAFAKHNDWFLELGKTKPVKIKGVAKPCIVKAYSEDNTPQDMLVIEDIKSKNKYLFLPRGNFVIKHKDMEGNLITEYKRDVR